MRIINRRPTILRLALIVLSGSLSIAVSISNVLQKVEAFSGGPSPSYTDAPGEANCTVCHVGNGNLNDGEGSIQISGIPHDYFPGQQVNVSVTTTRTDAVLYGFQLTAIDHTGRQAGTFSFPAQNPQILQLVSDDFFLHRQYIEHTSFGLFTNGVFGSNTWSFTWTAPTQRVGKVDFYAAGNAANSNGETSGDYIYTTMTASLSGSGISNFDGDFASDLAYFRPSTGEWNSFSILNNTNETFTLGSPGDRIAPGDYDGDGTTDFAVFRPSNGTWYIQRSTLGYIEIQWGQNGDLPVAGDYDRDGKTDTAVFRPSTNTWLLKQTTAGPLSIVWGAAGDLPAQGDYNGDGKTDVAVFRPSTATWHLCRVGPSKAPILWGATGDRPVQADYDGDGRTDIAVFRPSTGNWILKRSTAGPTTIAFGTSTDIPVPADYDGDGKSDIARYSPGTADSSSKPGSKVKKGLSSSSWHIIRSSDSSVYNLNFGASGDIPVASGYIAP